MNTDIKFLYPNSADRMNADLVFQLKGALRSVGEQRISQVQLTISGSSKISSNDGYSNEVI